MTGNQESLMQVHLMLGRLDGKVDALLAGQKSQEGRIGKLDDRVRGLERSRSWLLGAAAAISAVVSALLPYVRNLIP